MVKKWQNYGSGQPGGGRPGSGSRNMDRQAKMVIALMSVDTGAWLTTFCVASLPHAVTLSLLHIVLFVGRANNITGKVEKTNNQGPQLTLRRALL